MFVNRNMFKLIRFVLKKTSVFNADQHIKCDRQKTNVQTDRQSDPYV